MMKTCSLHMLIEFHKNAPPPANIFSALQSACMGNTFSVLTFQKCDKACAAAEACGSFAQVIANLRTDEPRLKSSKITIHKDALPLKRFACFNLSWNRTPCWENFNILLQHSSQPVAIFDV